MLMEDKGHSDLPGPWGKEARKTLHRCPCKVFSIIGGKVKQGSRKPEILGPANDKNALT